MAVSKTSGLIKQTRVVERGRSRTHPRDIRVLGPLIGGSVPLTSTLNTIPLAVRPAQKLPKMTSDPVVYAQLLSTYRGKYSTRCAFSFMLPMLIKLLLAMGPDARLQAWVTQTACQTTTQARKSATIYSLPLKDATSRASRRCKALGTVKKHYSKQGVHTPEPSITIHSPRPNPTT